MSVAAVCWVLLAMLPLAFALGSVPFGLLVGRARGVDVRTVGSKNIGATNVGRALGRKFFYLVLLLDALKAAIPAAIASTLVLTQTEPGERTPLLMFLWIAVGIAAMLGHVFSPFLKFKGGKGVACGLGLVLGTFPYLTLPGLIALAVFVVTFKLSRFVSLGSILAASSLPISYVALALLLDWDLRTHWPVVALVAVIALLVLWRHRENVRRLLAGTEMPAAKR